MKEYKISHLVKSEDLNHHGTLFAGRTAEWLVEAAFIAAADTHGRPQDILCVNVHGFYLQKAGSEGRYPHYPQPDRKDGNHQHDGPRKGSVRNRSGQNVEGFVTFVCVELDTKKKRAHNITLDKAENEEEALLRERALGGGK